MLLISKKFYLVCVLAMANACSSEVVSSQFPAKRSHKNKKHSSSGEIGNQNLVQANLPEVNGEIQAVALASQDIANEANPADVRYLSIAHQQSAGWGADDFKKVSKAINKLFNSLAWQPRLITIKSIDSGGLLFKIRLSDFGWDANLWNLLAGSHPAMPDSVKGVPELRRLTGSDKPLLRADWVIRSASTPPLYYQLLRVPGDLSTLLNGLKVSVQENIKAGRVIRAGFEKSIVSTNHRVIERHDLGKGFLWRSYEFGSKNGNRNIFNFPLGPSENGGGFGDRFPFQQFVSDGSEFYFTLPNGMIAFYIAGPTGFRINEVPGADDKKITAGISCFSCHSKAVMPARDEVATKTSVSGDSFNEVRRLYVSEQVFNERLQMDRQLYLTALGEIGIAADDNDPINAVVSKK